MIQCQRLRPIDLSDDTATNLNQTNLVLIYDVRLWSVLSVQLVTEAATAQFTLGRSNDGATPAALETATTLGVGSGMTKGIDCTGFAYLHVRLTTVEGSAKTGNVIVIAKAST